MAGQPPGVASPAGVASTGAKLRLVLDAGYPNVFERYQRFKYDQLVDITHFLEPGQPGFALDAANGFHHHRHGPQPTRTPMYA